MYLARQFQVCVLWPSRAAALSFLRSVFPLLHVAHSKHGVSAFLLRRHTRPSVFDLWVSGRPPAASEGVGPPRLKTKTKCRTDKNSLRERRCAPPTLVRRVVSDPHDHGIQKNGKVDNSRMGTNPRSAGFEPRASIFRGACAAPSGKDDDIEDVMLRDGVIHFVKPPSS